MKRTLLLDEDDLIMVVKEDVVRQIDEHRGEMNRTEFVNYLIQCQLRECEAATETVSRREFCDISRQMMEVVRNLLNNGEGPVATRLNAQLDVLNEQLEKLAGTTGETR